MKLYSKNNSGRFSMGHVPWNKDKTGYHIHTIKHIEELRRCMIRNRFSLGHIPWNKGTKGICKAWNKGIPRTEAEKEKISKNAIGKHVGSECYNWRGGYEHKLHCNRLYRIAKFEAKGSHTLKDWEILKAQYNWTCPSCGKQEPNIKLSEDHIIPLIKGGSNNIENIQPLCRSCNSRKHSKIIKYKKIIIQKCEVDFA